MMSEVEVTVRVMTPRKGKEPLYTAEKFIEKGDLQLQETCFELLRDTATLIERAANAVYLDSADPAEVERVREYEAKLQAQKTQEARERDAAEYDNDTKLEF